MIKKTNMDTQSNTGISISTRFRRYNSTGLSSKAHIVLHRRAIALDDGKRCHVVSCEFVCLPKVGK
ncbi:MAG TPA: hypothetical protein H9850_07070 [Candidatus Anaerobiospirillum pullistercoris]|uniref:Uncharacterized protein n=1 Tax=Candidatus Anaerobiospirillum pullistercoris TaxID=2838452 RepID=A0A9D1WDK5_9GAMM|nr:hypothetical protein [Candidatus Anaerobiospirillum pullistercoris]